MREMSAVVKFYNQKNKTQKTEREMLDTLYNKARLSPGQIGNIIGLSRNAVYNRLKRHSIKLRSRGRPEGSIVNIIKAFPETKLARMTGEELAEELGYSKKYILSVVSRLGIKLKNSRINNRKL